MRHAVKQHHRQHFAEHGISFDEEHIDCDPEEYQERREAWRRTYPLAEDEQLHTLTLGTLAHYQHHGRLREEEERKASAPQVVQHRHYHYVAGWKWILAAVIALLALLFAHPRAQAQFSKINTIQTKSAGSGIGFHASPFIINCSTNTACTDDGTTLTITASSTAATAFSALTAATNSNVGTFAVSGNSWDFSLATILKQRFSAGLTTSTNGDIGYDSTAKVWHAWQNAADRLLIAATNMGTSGQPCLSNADGSCSFADPITSGNQGAATTQTITATGALAGVTTTNIGTVLVTVSGTYAGVALNFEASPDGTFAPAFPVSASQLDSASIVSATGALPANTTRSWLVDAAGFTKLRINATAYTSGTANLTITPVYHQFVPWTNANITNTPSVTVSGTAAISAAALPLPANAAQETGGNLATLAGVVSASKAAVKSADGDFATAGTKADAANAATDTTAVSIVSILKEISKQAQAPAALPANQSTNVAQFGGSAVATGTGAGGVGIPRVTISNDSSLAANQSVNVAQVAGATTSTAASGVQKVGIVGNAGAAVDAATGAAPPANAVYMAGLGSGATGGDLIGLPVGDTYKNINVSTATTTLLVTGVSGRQVRISSLHMIAATADNVALIEGTGATCGTGTAGMAGGTTAASGYNFAANGGIAFGSGIGTVMQTVTTGDSVCIVTSAATQLSGGLQYTIY